MQTKKEKNVTHAYDFKIRDSYRSTQQSCLFPFGFCEPSIGDFPLVHVEFVLPEFFPLFFLSLFTGVRLFI